MLETIIMTNFKKISLTCVAMDMEEKGLNLLRVSALYRSDAKAAVKFGNGFVAATLMKKAVVCATEAHEYLAEAKAIQEEANKL